MGPPTLERDGPWWQALARALRRVGVVDPPDPPASRHDVLDGTRIHSLEWGRADSPTALLVHGVGQTAHSWNVIAGALAAAGWHVLVPDLRGHGDSEWSPGMLYSIEDHARDLLALCRRTQPTLLCGFSLGGMAAMWAAAEVSSLRMLVIVDTSPAALHRDDEGGSDDSRDRLVSFLGQAPILDSVEDFVSRAIAFNPARDPDLLRVTLPPSLRRLADGRWAWKYDPRPFVGAPGSARSLPASEAMWARVAAVTCPALVVRGELSPFLSQHDAATLADAVGGDLAVMPGAGHTCHAEAPEAFLASLAESLRRHLGSACPRS